MARRSYDRRAAAEGAPNETVLNSACHKQAKADHVRDAPIGSSRRRARTVIRLERYVLGAGRSAPTAPAWAYWLSEAPGWEV